MKSSTVDVDDRRPGDRPTASVDPGFSGDDFGVRADRVWQEHDAVRDHADVRRYRGAGCAMCHQTGYRRRIAIAEPWTPGKDEIELISQHASRDMIVAAARKNTYSLATDAMAQLREGRTTLDEMLRVLPPSALRELRSTVT